MQKIIVKRIPRDSVQRRHLRPVRIGVNPSIPGSGIDTGKVTNDNKASGAADRLSFIPDLERGVMITGLNESIVNPFYNEKAATIKGKYMLSDSWVTILKDVVASQEISRQRYYEILDGVEPEFYTSKIASSMLTRIMGGAQPAANQSKTFIEGFNIVLYSGANVFSSDTSRGRIAIQLIKNHPLIASSLDDSNTSHFFYIAQEDEEVQQRLFIDNYENEAIVKLTRIIDTQARFALYQIAVIMDLVRGHVEDRVLIDLLNRYIKTKGSDKYNKIVKFLEVEKLYSDNAALFNITYLVQQALNIGLITTDSGYLYWRRMKDFPERYRWPNRVALQNFLYTEWTNYDPQQPAGDNAYQILLEDLRPMGVKLLE